MKRIAILSILLIGSVLLSACISIPNATVNPQPTGESSIPNTGEGFGTSIPQPFEASATDIMQPVTGTGTPEAGQAATPIPYGTGYVESTSTAGDGSVPNTGASEEAYVRLSQLLNGSLTDIGSVGLGQVTDLVISLPKSRVEYAVVSVNGRSVLVPWAATVVDGSALVFSGMNDQLSNAPDFNSGSVNFTGETWDQSYLDYWNGNVSSNGSVSSTQEAGSLSPTQEVGSGGSSSLSNGSDFAVLASQLLRAQVVANGFSVSTGQLATSIPDLSSSVLGTVVPNTGTIDAVSLGTVQDLVINRLSGDIPWLLLQVNVSNLGLSNQAVPVPFSSLNHSFAGNVLYLSIDPARLQNAPTLGSGFPSVLGFGWDSSILNYWLGSNNLLQPTSNP